MIGNDIVDLQQARRESNWRRPRYLQKLFTPQEREWILAADEPERMVWLFWSSKEAAYKQWAAQYNQRVFIPKQIGIRSWRENAPDSYTSELVIGQDIYSIVSNVTADYIHSWTLGEGPSPKVACVVQAAIPAPGQVTRNAVRQHLAAEHAWRSEAITIENNRLGRPLVYHKGMRVPISLSLSHHGRYGAYAIVIGDV